MASLFERTTRTLVRRGIRDGLIGGNGRWLAVGAAAWLVRLLRRKPDRSVVVEKLRMGESIVVTHRPAPPFGRKARKLDRKTRAQARAERKEIRSERKKAKVVPRRAAGSGSAEE